MRGMRAGISGGFSRIRARSRRGWRRRRGYLSMIFNEVGIWYTRRHSMLRSLWVRDLGRTLFEMWTLPLLGALKLAYYIRYTKVQAPIIVKHTRPSRSQLSISGVYSNVLSRLVLTYLYLLGKYSIGIHPRSRTTPSVPVRRTLTSRHIYSRKRMVS